MKPLRLLESLSPFPSPKEYNPGMQTVAPNAPLDALVSALSECLTPESARRLLRLKVDDKLQSRVDHLADRCTAGALTPEECAEYGSYVKFATFVAILQSKARQLLADLPSST